MKIVSGLLKGRNIPFPKKRFPEAQTTPAKVKEAVFSILGEELSGRNFLDLFACSGQMGFEALSRGARFVLFNDMDPVSTRMIGDTLRAWEIDDRAIVLHMPAKQCIRYCKKREVRFDIAFLDPPYEKIRGNNSALETFLPHIGASDIFNSGATIIVQHYYANVLPDIAGKFALSKTKCYGTTAISVYYAGE
jgi:16S rRNA (guanine966-N2)-methyltransferase